VHDFHTHSFFSDGELSPMELIRRCQAAGYETVAITDHVAGAGLERLVAEVSADCQLAVEHYGFRAICGVEITHAPPAAIAELAARARAAGAGIVVVHGETLVEPVISGTNRAAVECPEVDILAHPGLISEEEAALAAQNGVFLEITTRKGHCLANGHVARVARAVGAKLVLGTDTHGPGDLISREFAERVLRAAGLSAEEAERVLADAPAELIRRAGVLA